HTSFLFTPPATPSIYTLSLHDALPILGIDRLQGELLSHRHALRRAVHGAGGTEHKSLQAGRRRRFEKFQAAGDVVSEVFSRIGQDRKSTRLNSSHLGISYAVFCLKKKK